MSRATPPLLNARLLALNFALASSSAFAQFATRVVDYSPAPGQFVNNPSFNNPALALGPPAGQGGLSAPDNSKTVTLGGFGGSITLAFNASIFHNPHNPHGMDFIIYGNGFYVAGDPLRRFAEPGIVEISRDDNHNGVADDVWYLVPGSHLTVPRAKVTKTYSTGSLNPLWVPSGRSGSWSVSGFRLEGPPFNVRPPIVNDSPTTESVWGFADLMPTSILGDNDGDGDVDRPELSPEVFYTRPDDAFTPGVAFASGGGCSFSIAWAVDAATGQHANLDRVDFVRVTTGVDLVDSLLGENSTEISAIADVTPVYSADWNGDAAVSVQDLFDFLTDWFAGVGEHGGADFNASGSTTVQDLFDFLTAWFAA